MNTYDLADATASLLAEQRRAMMERCGITVTAYIALADICNGLPSWDIAQDGQHVMTFFYEDAAYEYAYELASELIEQGDLS